MSEFHVEVCTLENVKKHENADTLSIGEVNGYPVIFRTGDYVEGEKVVHVPVDSICPIDDPQFAFLGKHNTIRPKRLRGEFSLGLLVKAKPEWEIGQDVQTDLRIERYDPDAYSERVKHGPGGQFKSGPAIKGPHITVYDIEGFRKYKKCFVVGEEVWASEKLHGASCRYACDVDGKFHVGSRQQWKNQEEKDDLWVRVATKYDLEAKLKTKPGFALYGEVYGQVQDLKYGAGPNDIFFAAFDVLNTKTMKWLDVDDFFAFCKEINVPIVPTLYRGPWREGLLDLCEGPSTVPGANHTREGFVLKPIKERFDNKLGRVVLKMVGQGYHMRDNVKEAKDVETLIKQAVERAEREIDAIKREMTEQIDLIMTQHAQDGVTNG